MTAPIPYNFAEARKKFGNNTYAIARDAYAKGLNNEQLTAGLREHGFPNTWAPFDYQVDGIDWITTPQDNDYGFSRTACVALLGDEMGIGKTAQALCAVRDLLLRGARILFLVPGQTIIQWQKNFDRWVLDCEPDEFGMTSLCAIRSSDQIVPKNMSCVMSHTLFARQGVLTKLIMANFDGVVIDEIHKFGAQGTKRIKHLHQLQNLTPSRLSACRIGLSGTPVRNYAHEMYNIANFLDPLRFRNLEQFRMKYLTYDYKALKNPKQFHDDFAPYYLRREVKDVQKSLPPIRRTKLYTEITDPFIRMTYNKNVDILSNYVNNAGKIEAYSLLGYLVKLRHITGIAKAQEPSIIEPLRDFVDEGNRLVIGLHHRFVYDKLKNKSLRDYPSVAIRGGMNDVQKEEAKQLFIHSEPKTIAYLSIKAAGEGIDGLQYAARKAVIFERQWNGADELQFEKRLHRTGQTQSVEIEYAIAAGTIDEFFDDLVEMKRRITTQVEDENWESNPAFLMQLAERVIAGRLPDPRPDEITKKDIELMSEMGIILDIDNSIQEHPSL